MVFSSAALNIAPIVLAVAISAEVNTASLGNQERIAGNKAWTSLGIKLAKSSHVPAFAG